MAQVPVSIVRAAGTDLTLTKTIEGGVTTAQVGDVIRYRIHFACSNLTTPCGPMEITDVLQPGLIYQPPPASSVPAGFSINYAAGTRTITITKDDNNLLDGSQYDAVIAVQVDYDLRPLPTVINNTVNGRIAPTGPGNWENTTPASAPPISIGIANPHWTITKTLSSPIIDPTVNTDVTYQIQLCPTTPPPGEGNVALSNITITDTLPTGATFVSASNGGTFSLGTVTWPAFAGPLYPPNCLTRFVTIRYDMPTFSVGNNVTNVVDFDADYIPSTGTCVSPCTGSGGNINHDIDPIFEVPTYSKSDTGDPIGFTGTGRFILNLNTNGTNYPSDQLILVDNLPPQLQVTSVTSGGWLASFDYVRAFVEYSTNNGSSYTAFPGQPISYNTNATYFAPAANITNVRWRFQYDPDKTAPFAFTQNGLPYTWAFTTSPQIRVTPRAAATTADPPSGAAMPAAVPGTTYDNCLQVTRTNSLGNPVTDACAIEQMTVQGTFVSLRTSKNETPGSAWDDLFDPNIIAFTPDGSILPGDTLLYTVTVEITERSSTPLVNPTIQDTVPAASDFIFVRNGTARLDGVPLPAAQQPTFSQAGQVLTWSWNNPSPALTVNPLALGSRFLTVEFYARVPRGQAPGTYTNDLYVVTDSVDAVCEIGTTEQDATNGDVDGDADATDSACRNPDTYIVERSAALRGEKWIRSTDALNSQVVNATTFLPDGTCPNGGTTGLTGGGSNPFTRFPCISQAFPEGALPPGQFAPPTLNTTLDDFEYNLRIFNDGNVPMLSYVLYDILPYVGDTGSGGTLYSSSRLSEFRPIMRGPVQFISGPSLTSADFTIEYNDTTNPCRPEVFDQPTGGLVPGGCNNTWTTTWSASALSYRIRLNAGSLIPPAATSSEVRFGVPMYIPLDAAPAGFDPNDALSHEIAWNSFSHVGAYDSDPGVGVIVQDLLASEPRKVGITVPERMSVGNRVWRDSDNNGTINAPDNTNPGIAGVTVNLYQDVNNDGIPDGAAISTTLSDTDGYYLFSNIPYDSAVVNNNRYIIGIPASNFGVGQPLESLRSSTGTPAVATYTNPTSNTIDSADDGIDPVTPGLEVFSWSFVLQPTTEPTTEADLSNNDRDGLPSQRRGVNGERDNNSDLTIDFGFFGGTDVPFSIGNHVWKDNGQTAPGIYNYSFRNDGIRQATEPVVVGATVRLYRDGNANGIPEAAEMIRTDITDANGFYLFDNLDPGPYYVEIPALNFATGGPLAGWYSSQPTGTENIGVNGGTTTTDIDNDDNGINSDFPETTGIFSGVVVLTRGVPEATGETYLSAEADPGAPANQGYNPTGWDGPGSIGRFGETDATSNLTIDFGFIPPMSLGNRVWIDEGAGTSSLRSDFDNGIQNTGELGVSGVRVELWRDTDGTPGLQIATDTFMYFTTTDATGYYLFDRLQLGTNYFVRIPASNFTGAGPLVNYLSSTDANQTPPPADDFEDTDDSGVDNANPSTNGINSPQIVMSYNGEPLTPANETDINTSGAYGPQNVGNYGQDDSDSNLTIDFGFVRPPRSIGNRLWIDVNNNAVLDGGELPVPTGVRVSLYRDSNGDGIPDDVNGDTIFDGSDALGYDLTDANGYYLFDHLPLGRYIVGVDYTNFTGAGLLVGYNSSRGNVDNASNNTDSRDNGVDRLQIGNPALSPYGVISTSIDLRSTPVNAPTGETGSGDTSATLGFNPTAGDGPNSRGRYGETDANSDLTIDFGFFIPMSIGNRVFKDDGTGGGTYNNGIMDGAEVPISGVRVELWRDANTDGVPDVGGLVDFDTTDVGGYYLFDDLAPGSYVVVIHSSNFTGVGPLVGHNTSTPTGTENVGVPGDPYTPNTDRDDNGLNVGTAPTTGGVRSGTITLAYTTEATGETELSGQADPGSPANLAFDPTGWDGPLSRGRWSESDANSNLTIDFGFIPVFSLGNRVFMDTNNNSARNGAEVGLNGVRVQLFASNGTTEILVGPDGILNTADDAVNGMLTAGGGYYLFNNLPAGDYIVRIPSSNFGAGQPLQGKWSSGTSISNAGVISETAAPDADTTATDSDDNGSLTSGNVDSLPVTLGPIAIPEPTGEADLNAGNQGQPDAQANMTVDFGFYTITLGNLVWLDNGVGGSTANDGILNGTEAGINGVTVQLWSQDLSTMLASTTTAGGGLYSFTGLPAGNYIVRLPASNFNSGGPLQNYRSSTGAVPPSTYEPAPNPDATTVDSDDNGTETGGRLGGGGYIQTSAFALTPAGEQAVANASGLTTENRVDFGLTELVALGNRVWFDTGAGAFTNNGVMDAGEVGVDNVTVQLFTSAGVEVPVGPDGILGTTDDATGGMLTSSGGYYGFDRLMPGTYYAFIPATEFQAGGDLFTYFSSQGNSADETTDEPTGPTVNENGIDNAAPATNGIRSTNFTLQGGTERTGEGQSNYTGTLADSNVNFTDDFGFVQKYSIGNRVWFDTNNSSTINGSEVGVDGVTVNLYAASNLAVILATDTTSNGGYYLFDDLYPGDYVVSVAASNFTGALNGYWSSGTSRTVAGAITETAATLANSDTDSDDNGTLQTAGPLNGAVISSTVTLGPSGNTEPTSETDLEPVVGQGNQANGRANMTVDFGFYKTEIGNLVFADADNSGHYNVGDTLLQNVTVQLYAGNGTTLLAATTTNASGDYRFNGQPEGNYIVRVVTPAGMTSTIDSFDSADNANPEINIDNNDNGIGEGAGTVTAGTLTMTAAEGAANININNATGTTTDLTVDFGFVPLYSLGNRIWFDTNNNSLMDAGEVGVNGVTVQLYRADGLGNPTGAAIATDITSGGGFYMFDDLSPRDYVVVITQANFASGGALGGYWSSATSLTGAGVITETSAPDADADVTDTDDNGTLDISGGAFNGAVLSKAVTLGPGGGTEPTGEVAAQLESGVLGNQGNQPDDRANMTVDFGFYRVEIGNLVYLDANGNGNYDGAPDTVIAGTTVRLFAFDGTTEINAGPDGILGTVDDTAGGMLTDAGGLYRFAGLPAGNYIVKVISPTGLTSTIDTYNAADTAAPDTNIDNNDNGVGIGFGTVSANVLTMSAGEIAANITVTNANGTTIDTTVDFGFINMVAIGNRVWFDTGAGGGISNNGMLDGGETGIANVTVELYASTGTLVASTTTDTNGYYEFDLLYPGTYYILIPAAEFQPGGDLENYFSSLGSGTDETSDENIDENGIDGTAPEINGIRSLNYTLTPGTEVTGEGQTNYTGVLADNSVNFTADFGFTQKYSLGNRVWFDIDNSSTINGTEVGIDGVVVNLYTSKDLTTILATDTTSNGGYYLFDDLYPGNYIVSIAAGNFGGVLSNYWSSGTTISPVGVISETFAPDVNTIPTDSDDNGTLQTGGTLTGAVISSIVTLGPSGNTEPSGETDLETGVGQGNQSDGRANMTVDFGFYMMTLGNLVWSDTDKNGAFNGAEAGIDGVTVELWSADGTTQLASTTTAGGGLYNFPGLAQGDYTVRVTAPVGIVSSIDTFDSLDTTNPTTNTDNNDNGVGTGSGTIVSNSVTLTPGLTQTSNTVNNLTGSTSNPSVDFGFTPVFSLGNRVWFDTDNSSTINGAEVGIDGVTVNLYAAGDLTTILASQVTANGGYYLFNGLQAGDYLVSVAASNFSGVLSGYWSSSTSRTTAGSLTETTAVPANSDADSDDNGMLQTSGALNGAVVSSLITLDPLTSAEPSGETDLDATLPGNQQGQPDTQANMTVDFGFYTITLGNQVWDDLDNNGLLDGAEVGYDNVTVELRSADGFILLGTTTTSGGGIYTFSGLPAGDYIVRLPAINFNPGGILRDYRSSTGPLPVVAYEPAPDTDTDTTDSDDNGTETNGLLGLGGYIQSLPVTLTPAGEQTFNDATGTTIESRVDFGVNNSPQLDLTVTKTDNELFYLAGGTLNYVIVVTNNGPADANGMTVTDTRPTQITSWTWMCAAGTPATYNCTDDVSNPATFTDSLDLPQLASVTYNVTAQVDPTATGDLINSVTVTPPVGMTDMTPPDNTSTDTDQPASLTVTKDDGVSIVAPDFTATYTITVTNTGATNLSGIQLMDTIPAGMSFVSASNGGIFASGQVTWPLFDLASGASTTFTVQLEVADLASLGSITSFANTVHVQDDGSQTGGTPVEADATDTDTLASGNTKTLTNSNQSASTNPKVLIGEILSYSIRIDIPVGTIANLKAVDVLDRGLAFVGCDATMPISSGSLILGQNPCTTPSALTVQAEPVTDTDPNSVNAGRRVTFDFGTVQNTSGSTQTLIVNYQVIVLDIADNFDGASGLNNNVQWQWAGGTLSGSASGVNVAEPQMTIEKIVDPAVASLGSIVTYTIDISHAAASSVTAFDVLMTDTLPSGLALIPGSITVNNSAGLPAPTVTTTTTQVSVYWASFPLGETATVTFQATFVGPSPVVNSANVEWSSIQIDPNPRMTPQSSFNVHSTERRYDPLSQPLNDYLAVSSATLTTPTLPETGFAPHVETLLPTQPANKLYAATDVILEMPSLGIKIPVVGIPKQSGSWDVSWLGKQAGWLEGSAFPSWSGNSVLTSHVYTSNGLPGPFVNLNKLKFGDQIIVHAYGQKYIFEVQTNQVVEPNDLSVFKHEEKPWLTLITCKEYDEKTNSYKKRVIVRAVLVKVLWDK